MVNELIPCRLCMAPTNFKFARTAIDGENICCYQCSQCYSLQTQVPHWLEAEYSASASESHLNLDTYAADRSLRCRTTIYFLWKMVGFSSQRNKLLDWGGGVGLMVRLLRDAGIDSYLYDKYAKNHYASGFVRSEGERYAVVTAFEVFEHFANPGLDIEELFSLDPSMLVVSTSLYKNQGPEWAYLGPAKSEHVFFYSAKAMDIIGQRFGYRVLKLRHDITIFYKAELSTFRLRCAGLLLSRNYIADVAFALIKKRVHAESDNHRVRAMRGDSF